MRKQFPVTQLTSGEVVDFLRLAFIDKKWRPKWSNVTLIWLNYPASAKNIITKANRKNIYLIESLRKVGLVKPRRPVVGRRGFPHFFNFVQFEFSVLFGWRTCHRNRIKLLHKQVFKRNREKITLKGAGEARQA